MADSIPLGARAVVLGASLAGLLAARVLSERYREVVLLERDVLPEHPAPRKGTPHATHPHGLLARGREVLETLFPGFTQALVDRGGELCDLQRDVAFDAGGRRFASGVAGQPGLAVSRLAIEAEVRQRVRSLPGLRVITNVDILAPLLDDRGHRVVAARYAERDEPQREVQLAADLVVDCTGRASRTPAWLKTWGYVPPLEEKVEVGICYVSAYFKRSGALELGRAVDKVGLICAVTRELPRPGVMLAQEPAGDGVPRWVVGLGGYAGDHAAPSIEGMRERALAIGSPELIKLTHEAEAIGEVMRYHYPYSVRRRYEHLDRFPEAYLALGDALTSFNPIYGQGMTVAACEALALRDALAGLGDGGLTRLRRRYFRAAARLIDIPWQLAVGGDLAIDAVPGPRPLPVRLINAYIARLYRAAPLDAVVSRAFLQVVHMRAAPRSLFAPGIVWRVWRKGGLRRAAATPAEVRGRVVAGPA